MANTLKALKKLGKKCNTSQTEPSGTTVAEVVDSIATNFNITGATGAHVTAMTLYVDDGVVTGGVATLSDSTEIEITVTTTPTT